MPPLVSFLIPTCRDESYAGETVRSILNSSFDFRFEIIICSKKNLNIENTIWVQEPEDNTGSVLPINIAYKHSLGEYIALLNDDFSIDSSFNNILSFLKGMDIKISALYPNKWIEENDLKYIPDSQGGFIPAQMMCFPVGRKQDFKKFLGENLLDSRFKHHWSDVWLTFFLYKKNGKPIELCKDAIIYMREATSSKVHDFEDTQRYFGFVAEYNNDFIYG